MSITLRDAGPADEAFLLSVYASTRLQELAAVPWDDAQREAFLRMQFTAQHSHYRQRFPDADYKVILLNEEPVGRLYVLRGKTEIRVLDIALLPKHRGVGIGAYLIRKLLNEAAQSEKTVRIYVESFNPSLPLFEHLGFSRIAEEGINFLMEWGTDS